MVESFNYGNPPAAPFVFDATPVSIARDNQLLIDRTQSMLDRIAAVPIEHATFSNVCGPLIKLENERQLVVYPMDLSQKLSPDAALRAAADDARKLRARFDIDAKRRDVFLRLETLYQRRDTLGLHPEHLKWLIEERRSYAREGMLLEDQELCDRYKQIKKRLVELATEFNRNFDEEVGPVCWFMPEELVGIPDDKLARLEKGEAEHKGKLKVDLSEPGNSVMSHCDIAATRKVVDTEYTKKGQANIALFKESVRLTREAVQMLGYSSTAAYRLEVKMAKTPEAVSEFLTDVLKRALPHRNAKLEELLAFKKADLAARDLPVEDELCSWDVPYYRRILESKTLAIDRDKVREYFPLIPTVKNMLKLFGSLFGFVFVEIQEEDRHRLSPTGRSSDLVWHEDVIMYGVWDDPGEGGQFRGYLYLDLYFREGKYRGYQCWPVNLGFETEEGEKKYPSTVLMTIFPKPKGNEPLLLSHDEMKLLFHELGHGIHDLSGASKCSRFFGASTAGDFNEAPSQMLEQWCYDTRGLKALSHHYKTGEQIPDSMIQAQLAAKVSSEQGVLMRMLRLALWDIEVYSAQSDVDLSEIYTRVTIPSMLRTPEDKYGYVEWRHLIDGGEASMYQYLWSKVHAMDMFDMAFRADPLSGSAGRRYRRMVLEKGAIQDEMKTLTEFLGREPSSEAYFRDLALL